VTDRLLRVGRLAESVAKDDQGETGHGPLPFRCLASNSRAIPRAYCC
jgi:hypothetical protein